MKQVVFRNKGLIDLRGITTFGVSAKECEDPIGKFGTGLKYAIAVCLRHEQCITLWRGKEKIVFTTRKEEMRDKEFHRVYMNNEPLPFTTELGKEWPLWAAYRELHCNTVDEPRALIASDIDGHATMGYTTFVITGEVFHDLYEERDTIILDSKPLYILPGLEVHEGDKTCKWIYYMGVRAHKLDRPSIYRYNLTAADIKLTEDRTLSNWYDVHRALAEGLTKSVFIGLIRTILEASEEYFESSIDFGWCFQEPGKTFNEVVVKYVSSSHYSGPAGGYQGGHNKTARTLYEKYHPTKDKPSELPREDYTTDEKSVIVAVVNFWSNLDLSITPGDILIENGKYTSHDVQVYKDKFYIRRDEFKKGPRHIACLVYQQYLVAEALQRGLETTTLSLVTEAALTFAERLTGVQLRPE